MNLHSDNILDATSNKASDILNFMFRSNGITLHLDESSAVNLQRLYVCAYRSNQEELLYTGDNQWELKYHGHHDCIINYPGIWKLKPSELVYYYQDKKCHSVSYVLVVSQNDKKVISFLSGIYRSSRFHRLVSELKLIILIMNTPTTCFLPLASPDKYPSVKHEDDYETKVIHYKRIIGLLLETHPEYKDMTFEDSLRELTLKVKSTK
jgi:hypothetical protein